LKVIGCQSDGAFAEFVAVPAEKVVRLDESLSFEEGSMLEPLAVGVHSIDRAYLKAGQSALILGAGTIGLMVLQAARVAGVRTIVADVLENRLSLARRLGADSTVNVGKEGLDSAVQRGTDGGPDAILECVGVAQTLQSAVRLARKGSRIVVVGVFGEEVLLPVGMIQDRELELVGDLMYLKPDFLRAQELVVNGEAQLKPILSRVFTLRQVVEAFSYLEQNQETAVKVMLRIT
jgi:L-iditol 2-dehydrogenase